MFTVCSAAEVISVLNSIDILLQKKMSCGVFVETVVLFLNVNAVKKGVNRLQAD